MSSEKALLHHLWNDKILSDNGITVQNIKPINKWSNFFFLHTPKWNHFSFLLGWQIFDLGAEIIFFACMHACLPSNQSKWLISDNLINLLNWNRRKTKLSKFYKTQFLRYALLLYTISQIVQRGFTQSTVTVVKCGAVQHFYFGLFVTFR